MDFFVDRKVSNHPLFGSRDYYLADDGKQVKFESCGTAGCIAGWCVLLEKGIKYEVSSSFNEEAHALLGINADAAATLFYTCDWPRKMEVAYGAARTPRKRAEIAAKRIEQFIKENK